MRPFHLKWWLRVRVLVKGCKTGINSNTIIFRSTEIRYHFGLERGPEHRNLPIKTGVPPGRIPPGDTLIAILIPAIYTDARSNTSTCAAFSAVRWLVATLT